MRSLFPIAATLCAAALTAQSPLTTTFASNSGQAGNMFDLEATNAAGVTVRYFEVNLDPGTWNMEIYKSTVPGPYLPNVNNAAAWTLVGSATGVTSAAANVPTICPIPVCEFIPANTVQSFYVTVSNGTAINYTNASATHVTGQLYASNADLNFYAGAGVAYPFVGNFNPRVWNGNIYYSVGADPNCATSVNFASKTLFGQPCYDDPRMVHEYFAPNTPGDLAGTSWVFTYSPNALGGNYTIAAGGVPYDGVTPAAVGLDLVTQAFTSSSSASWDDASYNVTLDPLLFGAGFPHPNGAGNLATEISVNSNGRIYLGSHVNNGFSWNGANSIQTVGIFQGTLGAGLPVIAGYMNDLDPTDLATPGHVWLEMPSPNGGVRITWDAINWQDTAVGAPLSVLNQIQMELLPGGLIFLSYGTSVGNGGSVDNEAVVGYSPGAAEPLSTPIDWSAISPFITTGSGPGIKHDASGRPVLGTTINLDVTQIPPATPLAGVIIGTSVFNPGVPLLFIAGVPCDLYASLDAIALGPLFPAGSIQIPLTIPNNIALSGAHLGTQGFTMLNPVFANPLNASMSNGIDLLMGN